ncbi:NAD(P)H-binding protein (plasmid) [Agrobacterium sp. rho-13.3]|uniref:NmrA family NAD(P)-binding protein n=1 Tax=Agrobacterium sp. rho-13.3 TaxID=3072980 RepID=UPI002A118195|nr:NAD(P)H-binding protein [Agrobacterium sp. rho-13.3]MDX8311881.1 NAD(P)H-binding protein [Agrobacterium sp. rho-13.3]
MSYIIHGATGAQGEPLYNRLLESGRSAIAAVRDPSRLNGKPAVATDMGLKSLVTAYSSAEGIFVHLPMGPEPVRVQQARNIVEAIRHTKPGRVVVSTSGNILDTGDTNCLPKTAIGILVRGIEESGVSLAVVAPKFYLENLLLPMVIEPVKTDGNLRYAFRADFAVSWSSHFDVAEVSERLLLDKTVTGMVGVGQLPGPTGVDLAVSFSRFFGRSVQFEALSPEAFGNILEPLTGPATPAIVHLYEETARTEKQEIADETSAQKLLGINPLTTEQWLARIFR